MKYSFLTGVQSVLECIMAATSSSNQSDDIMRHVSFSEVSSVMENIRNAKTANKQEIWRKYVAKFEKCHKKEVI